MSIPFRSGVLFLSIVAIAGCGRRAGPAPQIEKVVPVSGTLTYQGKPLDRYQVSFRPTDGRRPAVGVTDAAGRFVLSTNRPADGAPPGSHKVGIAWAGLASTDSAVQEPAIDDPAKLPKPAIEIPAKYANPDSSGLTQEVPNAGLKDLRIDLK